MEARGLGNIIVWYMILKVLQPVLRFHWNIVNDKSSAVQPENNFFTTTTQEEAWKWLLKGMTTMESFNRLVSLSQSPRDQTFLFWMTVVSDKKWVKMLRKKKKDSCRLNCNCSKFSLIKAFSFNYHFMSLKGPTDKWKCCTGGNLKKLAGVGRWLLLRGDY